MNIRNLYFSAGILLTLSIIIFVVGNSNSKTKNDSRIETKLVANDSLAPLGSVIIEENENSVTLTLDKDSNDWLVKERFDMPANFSKLSTLINNLADTEIIRLATSKPDRLVELGLEGNKTIRLLDTKGGEIQKVEIGKDADNGRQIIRLGDETKAYLVDQRVNLDSNALSWLNKELLKIDTASTTGLSLSTSEDETLNLTRSDAESDWNEVTPLESTNRSIKQDAIASLLRQVETIRFTDLDDKGSVDAKDASEHAHSFTIKQADGSSYTLSIGRRPEQTIETEDSEEPKTEPAGPVFISINASNENAPINAYMEKTAFKVSNYMYTNLVKSIDDLTEPVVPETKEENDKTPSPDE